MPNAFETLEVHAAAAAVVATITTTRVERKNFLFFYTLWVNALIKHPHATHTSKKKFKAKEKQKKCISSTLNFYQRGNHHHRLPFQSTVACFRLLKICFQFKPKLLTEREKILDFMIVFIYLFICWQNGILFFSKNRLLLLSTDPQMATAHPVKTIKLFYFNY